MLLPFICSICRKWANILILLALICLICRKWGNPATNKKDPAEAGSGSHVSNCEPLALDQKDGGVTLVFH